MKPLYYSSWDLRENVSSENVFIFNRLKEIDWLSSTPVRKEQFMSEGGGIAYTYGKAEFARTYHSIPFSSDVERIRADLNNQFNTDYNVCFLNRYENEKNSLDWHSDDSVEMNPDHPICVVSFGAVREIYWKETGFKGKVPDEQKQKLGDGSLFVMPAGFQQTHQHKIPKCDHQCGMRVSLTFRNYKV